MQVAEWVCSTAFSAQLASLFPIADSSKVRAGRSRRRAFLVRCAATATAISTAVLRTTAYVAAAIPMGAFVFAPEQWPSRVLSSYHLPFCTVRISCTHRQAKQPVAIRLTFPPRFHAPALPTPSPR